MNVRSAALSLATLAALSASAPRARAQSDPDPWFGRDKALHFGFSAAIAAGGYAASAPFFDARWPPLAIGGGVALAAGAFKETIDLMGYGDPSWRDFTWDVIGTVAGLGVAWSLDLLIRGAGDAHPLFGAPHAAASPLVLRF